MVATCLFTYKVGCPWDTQSLHPYLSSQSNKLTTLIKKLDSYFTFNKFCLVTSGKSLFNPIEFTATTGC